MMEIDLQDLLSFTKDLARQAGALILEGSHAVLTSKASNHHHKQQNPVDLVTEWDVKVENLIRQAILIKYPTFHFIGEESYSPNHDGHVIIPDEPTFCVDPIDGTTNFVHGFPFCCVSIGFLMKRKPVVGVIFNPFLNQLYWSQTGQGAYLTHGDQTSKLPLHAARPLSTLREALIAVEWGSDRSKHSMSCKSDSFVSLAGDSGDRTGSQMAHSLRSLGSAALNFVMVASGMLDLYWEIGCWPWDVAAGIVIAQESGAFVSGGADCQHERNETELILAKRKFIVIRAISDEENISGRDRQLELVKEFYATVTDWNP